MTARHRQLRSMAAAITMILALGLASCATSPKKGKQQAEKDNASVQSVKNRFMLGIQTADVDEVMSLLTADFSHPHFGSREDIHFYLSEARRRGFLRDVSVNMKQTEDVFGEDSTSIGPIEFSGLFGHINATLHFKQIGEKWYIHRVLVDI